MTFPVDLNLFGFHPHPHAVLEVLAYTCGFQLYIFTRKRWPRATVPIEKNLWVIVGCVFGALIGSKILAWIESPWEYWPNRMAVGMAFVAVCYAVAAMGFILAIG